MDNSKSERTSVSELEPICEKFSECGLNLLLVKKHTNPISFLTSPIFAIHVGSGTNRRTFRLHSALLAKESQRLSASINNDSKEAAERTIDLDEEDLELFGYFVSYLYTSIGRWCSLPEGSGPAVSSRCNNCGYSGYITRTGGSVTKHSADYTILARLYTLGDRMSAYTFQQTVLADFMSTFNSSLSLPDHDICNHLEIATTELPDQTREDPLSIQIFWYAACRLESLRNFQRFWTMLDSLSDMSKHLCQRARNSTATQPSHDDEKAMLENRFKKESVFEY